MIDVTIPKGILERIQEETFEKIYSKIDFIVNGTLRKIMRGLGLV